MTDALRLPRCRAATLVAVCSMLIAGCSADSGTGTRPLSTDPYLTARITVHSAVMSTIAPYDTLRLSPVAYRASGSVLDDPTTVTYLTNDTTVTVSPTGLVTARYVTDPSHPCLVIVSVRDAAQDATHADSLYVAVTNQTPTSALATLAIVRAPGDSAKVGVYDRNTGFYTDTLRIIATAQDGSDLSALVPARFSSADSTTAYIDSTTGEIRGHNPGSVVLRVTATYYGVTKTDTLRVQIGNPLVATVTSYIHFDATGTPSRYFYPNTITIGVGGTIRFMVWWDIRAQDSPMEVVFDDSSAVQSSTIPANGVVNGSGNIQPLPVLKHIPGGTICTDPGPPGHEYDPCYGTLRAFPHAGTYHYHSAIYGTTGTIVVAAP